mgnify:FL=1
MSLFAKVVNNEVTQVWDTQPPAGESGWKSAVEVKPAITANRQTYDGHTFDVSVDPVQIVYAVKDITVDDRKGSLISQAQATYRTVVQAEMNKEIDEFPSTQYDAAAVAAAQDTYEARVTAINACTTHEELDAL